VTFEESIGVPKDEDKTQEDKMPVLLEDDDTVEEHINDEEFQEPEDNSVDNKDDMHETEHQEDAEAEGAAPAPVPAAEPERRYPLRERRSPGDWFKAALATEELKEPTTYNAAVSRPDANMWEKAMDEEMTSLLSNDTWILKDILEGVKPIAVKWVYKIKKDAAGNIERYKARLVAKGLSSERASTTTRSTHQ